MKLFSLLDDAGQENDTTVIIILGILILARRYRNSQPNWRSRRIVHLRRRPARTSETAVKTNETDMKPI